MKIDSRVQKLRLKLVELGIDAIFISQPENRYYLSGFDGSAGFLLITENKAVLATDFRYTEQAKSQAPDYEIYKITNDMARWFPELITDLNIKKLGFEAGHITFDMYRRMKDILNQNQTPINLVPTDGLVESLRAVKELEEIDLITRAAQIGDSALAYIENCIQVGMTEKEVAWKIEKFIREHGSQSVPFDIIVASGPNSAMPHAQSSARTISAGEPIVIDIGARFQGYSSDLTRTICLGTIDDTFKKIYDIVLGAQLTAIAIIKKGMSGDQADNLARRVIQEAGYGEAFGHGLGHGVGLVTHEQPRLGPGSTDVLTSGMVFTIEPGIYLSGWGGVRIEDIIVIEKDKARVITGARKVR